MRLLTWPGKMPSADKALEVIKVGGSLFRRPGFASRLQAFLCRRGGRPGLLVPGGGELVDVLRRWHRRHGWSETAAHWAAVRALDVNAWLVHCMLPGSRLLETPQEFAAWYRNAATDSAARSWAVCAPWDWLRRQDWGSPLPELPATWDVTSDSIAAWVAGKLGAAALVLLKSAPPPGSLAAAVEQGYVDPWLPRVRSQLGAMELHAACLAAEAVQEVRW